MKDKYTEQGKKSVHPAIIRIVYGLLLLLLPLFLPAQETVSSIRGVVLDAEDNLPLPGVNILVKDTGTGTISDLDGRFEIRALSSDILVFSFVGYVSKEVEIGGQTELNIRLGVSSQELEEVVVIGYGQQKRSNLTGSISQVKVDNLENRPVIRLDQALQGMTSGVMVSKGGGAPGGSPTIHIRGVGSIGNTDPLWIVDGIKMNPGSHFNLDDVESVEILKDAASSAIYGAEAAHGVILITTKRGKKGKTQINYRSSFAKVNPVNLPELLGSEDFVSFKRQSREAAGQNPEPSWDNWEHDTDWIDAFYDGSGFSHYHDFSVARGTDRSNYYLSMGYDDENGILIDNNFQRLSLRLNSDFELADWITLGERVLISRVNENPIDNFNEDYNGAIPYRSIPIMPIYDETNPYGGWGRAPVYFQGPNPVASQYQQHEKRTYNRLDGNLSLDIHPFNGFNLGARVGYNYMAFLGEAFKESFDYGAFSNPINSLTYATAHDGTLTGNLVATYEKQLGSHYFKLMAGTEASEFQTRHFNVTATDFPVDYATSFNLATGTFNTTDRRSVYKSRLLSQFGRINYNYKEKYLFEANVRRDASAPIFSPENIWGIFPSFSAAWKLSEESFMKNISFISSLKLRASIGTLGSDNIGSYIYSKTYTSQFSSYAYDANGQNKESGFFISRFPNAEVKWEEVQMNNIGLDAEFLEGRLGMNLDFYIKDTRDLLYGVPIPASIGIAVHNFNPVNPEVNIGTMRNMGVDLDLVFRHDFGPLKMTLNANGSYMKNEILSLNADEYITGGSGGGQIGGMTRTQAGMPISSFYGFVVQQMLQSEADVYAINTWAADGTYQEAGTGPGDFMYQDISGPDGVPDGQVTWEHDRVFIGNPWPKFMYGLNINLDYNRVVDLLLQFHGVYDVDIFNANLAYSRNFFGDANTTTDIYEAWTPDNPTEHPRNIASDPNGNFSRPSTYFVEDGSYLKLRNIQLGFNVPDNFLKLIGSVGSIRFYLNANNIFTLTGYSGADPEISGGNISRGIDYGLYPHTRTFGGGIDVQF
jgi:TonB-linked SusC/RagA family outer membrane protein